MPVAKMTSVRLLISVSASHNGLCQCKNAFWWLGGESIYGATTRIVPQRESGMVCKLNKFLYGIKQSPLPRLVKLFNFLFAFGPLGYVAGHFVFYRSTTAGIFY